MTNKEALMYIDTLSMAYICDPQECGKKDGYNKDHFLCRGCDDTYEALAIATKALEKQIPKKPEDETYFKNYAWEKKCPTCGDWVILNSGTRMMFCRNCGQAIDWSEVE